MKIEIEFKTG